jgi:hypothetical protein
MQPFTQVDASTTRRYGGTGLGLAISRRLAERMGGRLWFHSLPGVGSDFRFTILARPAPPTSIDAAQGFAAAKLVAARVLLVEPNAAQRRSLVHLLEGWGLEVVVAQDVAASQRALVGPSIDVAVVDLDYVDASAHGLSGRNPPLVTLRSAGRRGDVREAWTVVKPVKAA